MQLLNSGTIQWILLAGSDEPRHFYDLVFAAQMLLSQGIYASSICLFSDYLNATQESQHILPPQVKIFSCAELDNFSSYLSPKFEHLAIAVSGHGNEQGIPFKTSTLANKTLRTEEWLACIRRSGKTKCFILLSQCYAGVSNFIDANPSSGCQFCIVGATGLHYSISFSSKAQNILIKDNLNAVFRDDWAANIFFVSFFNWLVHPVDVDGDGKNTVLDAYRYAGVLSGQWLIEIKCAAVLDIHRRIPALYSILNDPLSDNLKKEQAFSEIRQITIFLSEPQEPWILHANFARNIVI